MPDTFTENVAAARRLLRRGRRTWFDVCELAVGACGADPELLARFGEETGTATRLAGWLRVREHYGERCRPDEAAFDVHEALMRADAAGAAAELDARIAAGTANIDAVREALGMRPKRPKQAKEEVASLPVADRAALFAELLAADPKFALLLTGDPDAMLAIARAEAERAEQQEEERDRTRSKSSRTLSTAGAVARELNGAALKIARALDLILNGDELGELGRSMAEATLDQIRHRVDLVAGVVVGSTTVTDEELAELLGNP